MTNLNWESIFKDFEAPMLVLITFLFDTMTTVALFKYTLETKLSGGDMAQTKHELLISINYQYFIGLMFIKSLVICSLLVYVSVRYINDWETENN